MVTWETMHRFAKIDIDTQGRLLLDFCVGQPLSIMKTFTLATGSDSRRSKSRLSTCLFYQSVREKRSRALGWSPCKLRLASSSPMKNDWPKDTEQNTMGTIAWRTSSPQCRAMILPVTIEWGPPSNWLLHREQKHMEWSASGRKGTLTGMNKSTLFLPRTKPLTGPG